MACRLFLVATATCAEAIFQVSARPADRHMADTSGMRLSERSNQAVTASRRTQRSLIVLRAVCMRGSASPEIPRQTYEIEAPRNRKDRFA